MESENCQTTENIVDDENLTPLTTAIKAGYLEIAQYLLTHGKNIHANDIYTDDKQVVHESLLMDAIENAQVELALLLIEKGANITYQDKDGVTVLTQAAYQGLGQVVQALLARKDATTGEYLVNIVATNAEGVNALIAASSEGYTEIVNMLLATQKCDVNRQDKDGTNALMAASVRGHKEVVKVLVDHGANVNAQNVDGHTALMFAYNGKNQVETLLDKYSEYLRDAQDLNSSKIIQEALQTHVDVVNLLIEKGADVNLQDNEGHIAKDFDYKPPEIVASTGSAGKSTEGSIIPPGSEHVEL
jgi:ankyrin repeat protein